MSDHSVDINNISQEEQAQNGNQLSSQSIQSLPSPDDGALVLYSSPPQGTTLPSNKVYPPADVDHKDVFDDGFKFLRTLEKFHGDLGTKYSVPTIGGKGLDLHLLYKAVTSRGGLQKVIKDRKWKEITALFNFPSTATNASYVLRKSYINLLHHYEQVHFFKAKGHLISPPPTALPAPRPVSSAPIINESANPSLDEIQPPIGRRKRRASTPISGDPTSSVGHLVNGVISGKFEHGYLVTVVVGSEKLNGVLYQVPTENSREQFAEVSSYSNNVNDEDSALGVRPRRRRRRKDEIKKRDPDHPKPNRSGYNFFFAEQHSNLKGLHPGKDREISKMIGDSWNKLSEDAKSVYQKLGMKDKERYQSEMQLYRERQKSHSQDTEIPIARNEGTIKQLENQHGLQFQRLGTSDTNEGLNLQLDNHSNLCEHHQDHHVSAYMETKSFKMADLPDKSDILNTIVPKKQEALVNTTVSTDQQCSVDNIMPTKQESCIHDDKCKQSVSKK